MGNWWFVLGTAVVALTLPGIGRLVRPDAFRTDAAAVLPVRGRRAVVAAPVGVDGVMAAVQGAADARS
jgi:hypothetical protein